MDRHRELLAAMVAKRKSEEEESRLAAGRAMERRRRFKEALLARAIERRVSTDGAEEVRMKGVAGGGVAMTSAENDVVATVRDKIRRRYEKGTQSAKSSGAQQTSPPKRRLSARDLSSELNDDDFGSKSSWGRISWMDGEDNSLLLDQSSPPLKTRSLSSSPRESDASNSLSSPFCFTPNTSNQVTDSIDLTDAPVGSAVRAVRSRKGSRVEDSSVSEEVREAETEELTVSKSEQRKAGRAHRNRLRQYIDNLVQEKRAKEEECRLREKLSKKRRELLAVRVYNEAMERKLMAREDRYADGMPPKVSTESQESKPLRITPELSNAIYNRLVAKRSKVIENSETMAKASVSMRDFAEWKKRHALPAETKVFSISGWFPCVKEALLSRGWFQNKDAHSPYFDLKWTNKTMDIEHETLQPWQLANHFTKNVAITTKIGLLKSLNALIWSSDTQSDEIAPRSYDLSSEGELEEFVQDFKLQRAQCILKQIYFNSTGVRELPRCQVFDHTDHDLKCSACFPPPPPPFQKVKVNKAVFNTAISVLRRHIRCLDVNNLDNDEENTGVSGSEWEVLSYDVFKEHVMPPVPPEQDFPLSQTNARGLCASDLKLWRQQQKADFARRSLARADIGRLEEVDEGVIVVIHTILLQLRNAEGPQSRINGNFAVAKNIWIVKPAAKSRGRGICAFTDLPKLLRYVEAGTTISAQNLWIVQKYIENPLIIAGRKFDIRQWVLVTDWNPLTIYFYNEFYARFSVEKYR